MDCALEHFYMCRIHDNCTHKFVKPVPRQGLFKNGDPNLSTLLQILVNKSNPGLFAPNLLNILLVLYQENFTQSYYTILLEKDYATTF